MNNRLGPLICGGALLVPGLTVAWIASGYPVGTAARMGPGYLPLAAGLILAVLGVLIAAFDREPVDISALRGLARPALGVFAGLILWAMLAGRLGLVPATFTLVVCATLAMPGARPLSALLTAAILSAIGVAVFILGLKVRLDPFWF